jgi:hypothetical protein
MWKESQEHQLLHLNKCNLDYVRENSKYIVKSPTINTKTMKNNNIKMKRWAKKEISYFLVEIQHIICNINE